MARLHPLLVVAAGVTLLGLPPVRPGVLRAVAPAAATALSRDSIAVMAPRRVHTEASSPFTGRMDVPDGWRVEVQVLSRRAYADVVLALSRRGSLVPARLSRWALQSVNNPGPDAPRRPVGEPASLDSLGCRFYPVKAVLETNREPDSLGFFHLSGSVIIDSVTIHTHTRVTVYDDAGRRSVSLPLEAR